jgi:hypothetical protein
MEDIFRQDFSFILKPSPVSSNKCPINYNEKKYRIHVLLLIFITYYLVSHLVNKFPIFIYHFYKNQPVFSILSHLHEVRALSSHLSKTEFKIKPITTTDVLSGIFCNVFKPTFCTHFHVRNAYYTAPCRDLLLLKFQI